MEDEAGKTLSIFVCETFVVLDESITGEYPDAAISIKPLESPYFIGQAYDGVQTLARPPTLRSPFANYQRLIPCAA